MTNPAVQPQPEDLDWTYVIIDGCADCGFDPTTLDRADLPVRIRAAAGAFRLRLGALDARTRPAPAVWSPTEYACHVRDTCTIMNTRARLMLDEENPVFANWDQDASAIEQRYWEQEPAAVADQLEAAADAAATTFATVAADAWDRPGRRARENPPSPRNADGGDSSFTVGTLGTYFLHDLEHHVWDVTK